MHSGENCVKKKDFSSHEANLGVEYVVLSRRLCNYSPRIERWRTSDV
jgi:hypothetical protein